MNKLKNWIKSIKEKTTQFWQKLKNLWQESRLFMSIFFLVIFVIIAMLWFCVFSG